jgi:hypothetical protein
MPAPARTITAPLLSWSAPNHVRQGTGRRPNCHSLQGCA